MPTHGTVLGVTEKKAINNICYKITYYIFLHTSTKPN